MVLFSYKEPSPEQDYHNKHCKSYLEGKHNYVSLFDTIKDNNYVIEVIEDCNFNTKDELRLREQHHINMNENCTNK